MLTILVINGTDYDGGPTGWAAQGITDMQFEWDIENPWSFSFSVYRKCNGDEPYPAGSTFACDVTEDDGSGRRHVFVGDLQTPQGQRCTEGYSWNYTATDLKTRANYITLSGLDNSGTASFNLAPDDPLALYALSGMTVGDILKAILEQVDNATALDAAGVGNYVSLSPPALPAATLADLALMTVVPNTPVQLRGESILNTLEQFALHWHPKYCSWIDPADGTIRWQDIFSLTPQAVALPSSDGSGDDVDWPNYAVDLSGCYTAWQIQGLDIQSVTLSTSQGTLAGVGAGPSGSPASGWSTAQQSAWTIADFISPRNASDDGALSSVTSSSASVHSDYPAANWPLNFWNGTDVQGWIWFFDPSATGINIYENRQITSCTALTAGGTATVTWDSSVPLNSTGYTRYRIVGNAAPQSLVSRKFFVREPATGDTGLNTFVGSHMYPRNSKGMPVANNSRVFNVFYPYAFIRWSRTGSYPWFEVPVNVQEDPLDGSLILTEPAVLKAAGLAGSTSGLGNRYPPSFAEGLPADVVMVIPYNRGALSARSPSSSFSGTAFTKYGIERTFVQKIDTFNWLGDQPALAQLAAEHLATVRDAVVSGTLHFYELPAFDVFTPGFSLNMAASGSTTPMDGLDLPARAATIRWHDSPDPVLHSVNMRFNNRRRPFEGDSLYIHPTLGRGTFGMQGGGVFGAEMMGMAQAAAGMMRGTNFADTPMGATPMGQSPMGQDVGHNPISDAMAGFGGQQDVGMGMGMGGFGGDDAGGGRQKSSTRDASGMHRSDAEIAAGNRRAEREAGQRQAARRGAEARGYEKEQGDAPLKAAMEARKEREQQQKDHAKQIREARERGTVGPKEPIAQKLQREANQRGEARNDAEFGPLSTNASGSAPPDDTGAP